LGMKGTPERQSAIYHTFNVEDLIEPGHPLRPIKRMVDRALAAMSRTFRAAYSDTGRPGIPPETLLKALLLQCLYTIPSFLATAGIVCPFDSSTSASRSLFTICSAVYRLLVSPIPMPLECVGAAKD
jgi:hypothetical protein